MHSYLYLTIAAVLLSCGAQAQTIKTPRFRAVAMTERGGIHQPFVDAAKAWLQKLSADSSFSVDYIYDAEPITDEFLSKYQLFIQLNYPPYMWSDAAKAAFIRYIETGAGGWIGFHHATLLGEFDGYPIWPWFSDFMGGIRFVDYIPGFASGKVNIEAPQHPVMKNIPSSFIVDKDEWYVYNKSPRKNVRVLASVDESTYRPETDKKMGDHPVVWTNERMKARNIYIFMGHHPGLFENPSFTALFRNSIFWASQK